MIKLVVAGSRSFTNYELMRIKLNKLRESIGDFEVVSGKARGADSLGERYAKEYSLPIAEFPADWDRFGKSAGFKRNEQMAQYADAVIVFWDGKSKGSQHMINIAKNKDLPLREIIYE